VFVLTQTRSKEDKSMPQPELIALIYAFTDQTRARQAFEAMRRIIFTHECQLSAYRYWIGSKQAGEAHFVMVVGDPATFALKDHMSRMLTHFGGTEATLAADMVEVFYQHHREKMGWC
jgi:hypothetical protein